MTGKTNGQDGKRGFLTTAADRLGSVVSARLRGYFIAGVLITAPVSITLYLAWVVLDFIDTQVAHLIPEAYNPNTYLPFSVPGLGLVLMLVGLTFIGFIMTNVLGRLLMRAGEAIVRRMPILSGVYSALKQILETVLSDQTAAFQQVVLVEYPRERCWAMGFVSSVTAGEVQARTEEDMINVFIPTTPNPTSGFLLFVPKDQLVFLEMTVDEGLKMIISGGLVAPSYDPEKSDPLSPDEALDALRPPDEQLEEATPDPTGTDKNAKKKKS